MRVRNAIAACLLAAACQRNPAPAGWLPEPDETPDWPYGGWIELELTSPPAAPAPALRVGELLAVAADTVWIMTDDGASAVARRDVRLATLMGWDPVSDKLVVWTALGAVSTLSNGAFLLLTAPAWIIGGSLTTAAQTRRPMLRTDRVDWAELRRFARFPQGMPPGVSLTSLGVLVR